MCADCVWLIHSIRIVQCIRCILYESIHLNISSLLPCMVVFVCRRLYILSVYSFTIGRFISLVSRISRVYWRNFCICRFFCVYPLHVVHFSSSLLLLCHSVTCMCVHRNIYLRQAGIYNTYVFICIQRKSERGSSEKSQPLFCNTFKAIQAAVYKIRVDWPFVNGSLFKFVLTIIFLHDI